MMIDDIDIDENDDVDVDVDDIVPFMIQIYANIKW